jgi:hypothetical protein
MIRQCHLVQGNRSMRAGIRVSTNCSPVAAVADMARGVSRPGGQDKRTSAQGVSSASMLMRIISSAASCSSGWIAATASGGTTTWK